MRLRRRGTIPMPGRWRWLRPYYTYGWDAGSQNHLAHAAVMVATSPKSNASYVAIDRALEDVEKKYTGEVPMHLRNAPAKGMESLGYSVGYKYAHDYPGNIVYDMEYLPPEMKGTQYYHPTSNGYEMRIKEWLDKRRKKQGG